MVLLSCTYFEFMQQVDGKTFVLDKRDRVIAFGFVVIST